MNKIKAESFERRAFLRSITAAAGVAGSAPLFLGAIGSTVAIPAEVEAAENETGQTIRLAEYAVRLRHEQIPAEVLQRAKDTMADTVATILFGGQFPWSKMIIAQAQRMGKGGKCTILGT